MNLSEWDFAPLALSFVHVVAGVVVLIVAKWLLGLLSPYSTDQEMTAQDNPAFGLAVSGYYAAVILVYLGSASIAPLPVNDGTTAVFLALGRDLLWALAGILALNASRLLLDRTLVSGVRNHEEIQTNRNVAAGALECAGYLASGLILAGAVRQPGGSPLSAAVLFVVGQAVLIGMGRLYQKLAGYSVSHEIRSQNLAAGAAFGLTLVALSLLMLKAITGEFIGWSVNLSFFAFDAIAGLALLLFLRWVVDLALLPNARIAEEIVRDRNTNVGLVEGVLAVGISSLILVLF